MGGAGSVRSQRRRDRRFRPLDSRPRLPAATIRVRSQRCNENLRQRRPEALRAHAEPLAAGGIDLLEAGGHYEEHCAVCHADNGGGDPKFHGIMYPRPTDLRSADTQEMSDGELYWVVKNGVRWSGMPAFGKPGDDDEHAWKSVAYVRHLPKLTPAEQQQVIGKSGEPMNHDEHAHDHTH